LAERLLQDKKYEASVHEFQQIVDKEPNGDLGKDALYRVATIQHHYMNNARAAEKTYRALLKRSTDKNFNKNIQETLANIYFDAFEDYPRAVETYSALYKENIRGDEAEYYSFKIGKALFLMSRFSEAIEFFRKQQERYPKGKYFYKAELEIGNAYSASKDCKKAVKSFDLVRSAGDAELKPLATFAEASCYEDLDVLDKAYDLFASIRGSYPVPSVVDLKMSKIKRRRILRRR